MGDRLGIHDVVDLLSLSMLTWSTHLALNSHLVTRLLLQVTATQPHRPFGPKQFDIYKKARELFDRALNQGHFGILIIKIC